MSTWFVSRHPGAVEWARLQGISVDHWVKHLDLSVISAGDYVIGSLPVNLAEAICQKQARYFHLCLELPDSLRGTELSVNQMEEIGAKIQEYSIYRIISDPQGKQI